MDTEDSQWGITITMILVARTINQLPLDDGRLFCVSFNLGFWFQAGANIPAHDMLDAFHMDRDLTHTAPAMGLTGYSKMSV